MNKVPVEQLVENRESQRDRKAEEETEREREREKERQRNPVQIQWQRVLSKPVQIPMSAYVNHTRTYGIPITNP